MKLFELIHITGPDSAKFLQTQVTADISRLEQENKILSAYCNRQGRVISVFFITRTNDEYHIVTLGATADKFLEKIKKLSIFSKIQFNKVTDDTEVKNHMMKFDISDDANYYFDHKIPIIMPFSSEEYLPDNLNLLNLDAVSFKKGCFLGQEIIARVYYKGKTKKHLHVITFDMAQNTEEQIQLYEVTDSDIKIGELIFFNGTRGLAVLDNVDSNYTLSLSVNGMHAKLT